MGSLCGKKGFLSLQFLLRRLELFIAQTVDLLDRLFAVSSLPISAELSQRFSFGATLRFFAIGRALRRTSPHNPLFPLSTRERKNNHKYQGKELPHG